MIAFMNCKNTNVLIRFKQFPGQQNAYIKINYFELPMPQVSFFFFLSSLTGFDNKPNILAINLHQLSLQLTLSKQLKRLPCKCKLFPHSAIP